MDGFVKGKKTFKTTPEVVAPLSQTHSNIEKVSHMFTQNCYLSLQMIADKPSISKDTVQKIVVEDLKNKKVCLRFVPHTLTAEQD
jgi:anti-sigma-K factor RskA